MAWIESHQSVWEHAKTRKAARRLDIPTVQVVGHLQSLWHWAIDHAEDGNLSKYDPDDLAIAARWDGDPDELVNALVECGPGGTAGFLERGGAYGPPDDERAGDLVIHDWWEYAGKLIARRRRDRERKRTDRSDGPPEDVRETSNGQESDGPKDDASRGTNQPTLHQPDRPNFKADFWEQYPKRDDKRVGQKQAKDQWSKLSAEDQHRAVHAVHNYRAAAEDPQIFCPIKDPWRWLRDRWFDDWQEPAKPAARDGPKTAHVDEHTTGEF